MTIIEWTFTIIGIWISLTAALFAILQYFNKGRKGKIIVLKRSVYMGSAIAFSAWLVGFLTWAERNRTIPLLPEERTNFHEDVLGTVGRFRLKPFVEATASKEVLDDLIDRVEKNRCYEKEMSQDTAILYRLYGATVFWSGMGAKIAPIECLKRAYPYLKKSFELDPRVWQKPHEESSYRSLRGWVRNKGKPVIAEDLFFSLFTVAMVGANEVDVRNEMKPWFAMITGLAGKPKDDYEYFIDSRQKGPKGLSYGQLITTIRIMVQAQGGRLDGPMFLPTEDGKTLVRYVMRPKNKPEQNLEWFVDKDKDLIEPRTILAEELHLIIKKDE